MTSNSMRASRESSVASVASKPKRSVWQRIYKSHFYNIFLLALAWAATLTSSTLLTTVGPLSMKHLGGQDSLATFTIGTFLIGAAISSVPSGPMFRYLGRRWGFIAGCLMQIVGGAIGMLSMQQDSTNLLLIGCLFVGLGQGIGQFYRFSATELTPDKLKARAVTYVLTGGVLAAFLGPVTASASRNLFEEDYMGSFFAISLIGVANTFVVLAVNFPKFTFCAEGKKDEDVAYSALADREADAEDSSAVAVATANADNANAAAASTPVSTLAAPRRSLYAIISQPLFIISCLIPTSAHTMMVMLMSSVTLAMLTSGFSFQQSSMVMVLHFLAMFSPGFVTGTLIGLYGALAVSICGGFLFACSTFTMWAGESLYNYIFGMILCGVGWNFSFSAGTVMLMGSYQPQEATDVQAFNDFILFSIAGGGSLVSGTVYSDYGWITLIYVVSCAVVLNILLFVWSWRVKNALEKERSASNLYHAINPVALAKAMDKEQATLEPESSEISDIRSHQQNKKKKAERSLSRGEGSGDDDDSDDNGDVVQGVEWWQPATGPGKSYSFAIFGRKFSSKSAEGDQREVMLRSTSVI